MGITLNKCFIYLPPSEKYVPFKFRSNDVYAIPMLKEAFDNVKDQMGPCGIACGTCDLGNGTVAESALKLQEYLKNYGVASWAGAAPSGSDSSARSRTRSVEAQTGTPFYKPHYKS